MSNMLRVAVIYSESFLLLFTFSQDILSDLLKKKNRPIARTVKVKLQCQQKELEVTPCIFHVTGAC